MSKRGGPADVLRATDTLPPWAIPALAVAVAGGLFLFSLSSAAYEATTLPDARVLSRKLESLVAFALVGFLACWALRLPARRVATAAAIVAAYSAAIEVGQYLTGAREGLMWNAIDVACGAAGGALGGLAYRLACDRFVWFREL